MESRRRCATVEPTALIDDGLYHQSLTRLTSGVERNVVCGACKHPQRKDEEEQEGQSGPAARRPGRRDEADTEPLF